MKVELLQSKMYYFYTLLIVCVTSVKSNNLKSISLNGDWTGYIESRNLSFNAKVPGGIYTDLFKANLIPGNLYGFNDVENRWVAYETVNYLTYFTVNESMLEYQRAILTFYGLDTFATIFINDKQVGNTSNMFTSYSFDVKNYLHNGENKVNVTFDSSVKIAKDLYEEQSKMYPIYPQCVPPKYNGECHVNHIRKMQASYSWDWGPAFPSVGIWKNVDLVFFNEGKVSDATISIKEKTNNWEITVMMFFYTVSDDNFNSKLTVRLVLDNRTIFNSSSEKTITPNGKQTNATFVIEVPKELVELWWPNGHGEQILYKLYTETRAFDQVAYHKFKIGFRTVELVQEPLEKGLSFYFRINGLPIFAKGSNWIPSSIFPEKTSEKETVKSLLFAAKVAHMNMLRVWGGGLYESNYFYDLADEFGIMIWQDFMFACAMYPSADWFLTSIKKEIVQNVWRLQHHPSIVLWGGNNENEAALWGNWYGTGTAQVYRDDYKKLYVNLMKGLVEELDSSRPYVVSSPSNGKFAEENNYLGTNPQSTFYGDVHYYNYVLNGWDINQYPTTRFASEYGVQSFPSLASLKSVAPNSEDLYVFSEFLQHRQHLPSGEAIMNISVSKNFDLPNTGNTTKDLDGFIYLSQINQAVSIRIETEHYRQMMSNFNKKGEGMTMGALYWQLNDVWQAPSWSSIEFSGRWKMLHYYAVDFFSPVIVTSRLSEARELSIYVISDLHAVLDNIQIYLSVYKLNAVDPITTTTFNYILVNNNTSQYITSFWLDDYLRTVGCGTLKTAKKNCLLELELKDNDGTNIAPLNYVYPSDFKALECQSEKINVSVKSTQTTGESSNTSDFSIEVTSDKLSLFVWLDVGEIRGRFSANGFHMTQGKKQLTFHSAEATTVEKIVKSLNVKTLCSIYNSSTTINVTNFF